MTDTIDRAWVESLLRRNRYLVLSTTDGARPWVAPVEYVLDAELNFYFFSTIEARHVKDLAYCDSVAVVVFDSRQPTYTPTTTVTLKGVQIEAAARKLARAEYPDLIVSAIAALKLPMPPYEVFKIEPRRFFVPRIENGVNVRVEVAMV